jgi:hypothetical protein
MADSELIEDFFRTERDVEATRILVRTISWHGPHTPVSRWVKGATLSCEAAAPDVEKAVQALLRNPKFFAVCGECSERKPVGYMHDEIMCQGCASRNHGVVY